MLTITELRQMDLDQLSKEIAKEKQQLFKLKLQTAAGQMKETHQLQKTRRYIAQIETIKSELIKKA